MITRNRLPLEQALLGFLMQGPAHGYDLDQRVKGELGQVWYMGISNIYAALQRLEDAGYVQSEVEIQTGRPSRKVIRIAPSGREHFLDWVRSPVPAVRDIRVEFIAKLFFLHGLRLDGMDHLISAQQAFCQEQRERLEQAIARCSADDFHRLVLLFRKGQIEAILQWLQTCREELERLQAE